MSLEPRTVHLFRRDDPSVSSYMEYLAVTSIILNHDGTINSIYTIAYFPLSNHCAPYIQCLIVNIYVLWLQDDLRWAVIHAFVVPCISEGGVAERVDVCHVLGDDK